MDWAVRGAANREGRRVGLQRIWVTVCFPCREAPARLCNRFCGSVSVWAAFSSSFSAAHLVRLSPARPAPCGMFDTETNFTVRRFAARHGLHLWARTYGGHDKVRLLFCLQSCSLFVERLGRPDRGPASSASSPDGGPSGLEARPRAALACGWRDWVE